MPVLAFWLEDAFHMVIGEGTQKARNLAADARCAIGTQSTTLPSLDITAEGRAEPLTDPAAVARITELLKANGWRFEVDGVEVTGPSAPSAGPPPYRSTAWSPRGCSACRARMAWTRSRRTSS